MPRVPDWRQDAARTRRPDACATTELCLLTPPFRLEDRQLLPGPGETRGRSCPAGLFPALRAAGSVLHLVKVSIHLDSTAIHLVGTAIPVSNIVLLVDSRAMPLLSRTLPTGRTGPDLSRK